MKAVVYSGNEGICGVVSERELSRPVLSSAEAARSSWCRSTLCWLLTQAAALALSTLRVAVFLSTGRLPNMYGEDPHRYHVLCKTHAVGVNPCDAKMLYGDKVPVWALQLVAWSVRGRPAGMDFSGVVVQAAGPFRAGDEVFGVIPPFQGSLAEYVLAPSDAIALKPRGLSHCAACVVPLVGLTALQLLDEVGGGGGELRHVLVVGGSGGVGHCVVQLAKRLGARVTAVCSRKNAQLVAGLGADEVVPYDAGALVGGLLEAVQRGGQFDLVVDTVSSNEQRDPLADGSQARSYPSICSDPQAPLLRPGGRYVRTGGPPGDWLRAHLQRHWHLGLSLLPTQLFWVRLSGCAAQLRQLCHLCESGQLRVLLSETLPFTAEGVSRAFRLCMTRRVVGKIAISLETAAE
ncbi:hypothetical protein B484DRAFT_282979 [Ochromonadaceae sp. CCMP2298]|nr:hypothetical protein B484DRAFT_282979 [Ochromonadaceae sp. CCMP2298]